MMNKLIELILFVAVILPVTALAHEGPHLAAHAHSHPEPGQVLMAGIAVAAVWLSLRLLRRGG
jgi:hypothetical protein